MNKKYFTPFLALSAFILIVGCMRAFSGDEDTWICDNGSWVKHGHPSAGIPKEPCNTKNIMVATPRVNDLVTYPFVISGKSKAIAGKLSYEILDSAGNTIKKGTLEISTKKIGEFGSFELKIQNLQTEDDRGILNIFDASVNDAKIEKVTIPVRFK